MFGKPMIVKKQAIKKIPQKKMGITPAGWRCEREKEKEKYFKT